MRRKTYYRWAGFLISFVFLLPLSLTSPTYAITDDYPDSNAAYCGEISVWCVSGNSGSPRGYIYRNCTDYVAWKVDQIFDIDFPHNFGDASDWGDSAYHVFNYDTTPRVGDIAQWDSGHVAYVYAVKGSVANLAEYNLNYSGRFSSSRTTASSSAGEPNTYIHIADLPPVVMTSQVTGTNTQHIYTGDDSGKITELWWKPHTDGIHKSTLTTLTGVPTDIVSTIDGSVQHIYTATAGGDMYETWWSTADDSKAVTTYPLGHVPHSIVAISTQNTGSTRHVYAVTTSGDIYEAWWVPHTDGIHLHNVGTINKKYGQPVGLSSQVTGTDTQHLYIATSDGSVHEVWWKPHTDGVHIGRLTTLSGKPTAIDSYTDGTTQYVYVASNNRRLTKIWWKPHTDGIHTKVVASKFDSIPQSISHKITGGTTHHIYTATSRKLYETWWKTGSNTYHHSGKQLGKSIPGTITDSKSQITGSTQHIYTVNTSGQIYETWWVPHTDGVHMSHLATL